MDQQLRTIWLAAVAQYGVTLSEDELQKIENIKDRNALLSTTQERQDQYNKRGIVSILGQLRPFLETVDSFSRVVNIFLQVDPGIFALVWGSISLILEVRFTIIRSIWSHVSGEY